MDELELLKKIGIKILEILRYTPLKKFLGC